MMTREAIKTEIDVLPDESLDVLYRFIQFLETSLKELRLERPRQPITRVQKLEGIWEGLGFEQIADIETSIREIRQDAEKSMFRRLDKWST